jgi:hypothetical protein
MDNWNPAPTSRCDRCGKEYPAEELGSYYSRHFARKSGRICGDCVADFVLDIANAGFRARALGALEERGEQ